MCLHPANCRENTGIRGSLKGESRRRSIRTFFLLTTVSNNTTSVRRPSDVDHLSTMPRWCLSSRPKNGHLRSEAWAPCESRIINDFSGNPYRHYRLIFCRIRNSAICQQTEKWALASEACRPTERLNCGV